MDRGGEHLAVAPAANDGEAQLVGLVGDVLLEQVCRGRHSAQIVQVGIGEDVGVQGAAAALRVDRGVPEGLDHDRPADLVANRRTVSARLVTRVRGTDRPTAFATASWVGLCMSACRAGWLIHNTSVSDPSTPASPILASVLA